VGRLSVDLDTAEQFHELTKPSVWTQLGLKQVGVRISILIAKISFLLKKRKNKKHKKSLRVNSLARLD